MTLRDRFQGVWILFPALLADRLSKLVVSRSDPTGELLPGLVRIRSVRNTGVAFSMLSGGILPIVLTIILIAVLTAYLLSHSDPPIVRTGLWLITAGGLGNLCDRLFYGAVIDFIEPVFVRFAVFNVADIFVCLGALLVFIGVLHAPKA